MTKWILELNSSSNKVIFFEMELECSKLEFQTSKPRFCNFYFYFSQVT